MGQAVNFLVLLLLMVLPTLCNYIHSCMSPFFRQGLTLPYQTHMLPHLHIIIYFFKGFIYRILN